ncbi:MAG TPA: hypothetical protein V6D08_11195 [Candidatus Obscuribacterales bacterium]
MSESLIGWCPLEFAFRKEIRVYPVTLFCITILTEQTVLDTYAPIVLMELVKDLLLGKFEILLSELVLTELSEHERLKQF